MNKESTKSIRLGLFVLLGAILLITALYLIGNNRKMFKRTFNIYSEFRNVNGLRKGNNVRYAGIDIGIVDDIELVDDTTIRVQMSIEHDLIERIHANAIVSVGTDGLMGSKLINIEPGVGKAALIKANSRLMGASILNTDKMLRTLDKTNENLAIASDNIVEITSNISQGRGTLYTVLNDTLLSHRINRIVGHIENASMDIEIVSADAKKILKDVKEGNGVLGALLTDTVITENLSDAVRSLKLTAVKADTTISGLNTAINNINHGNGTLSILINDTIVGSDLKLSLVNIKNGAKGFGENMDALKANFLLKGYFDKQLRKQKQPKK